MRSSRLSRDTASIFSHSRSPSVSPPRRTTRSSLARFNCSASTTATPDIEDAPLPPSPPSKRRKPNDATKAAKMLKEEIVQDALEMPAIASSGSPPRPSPKRARKPARKVKDGNTGETVVIAPSQWKEIYDTVKAMRQPGGAAYPAAVDTMGCERLADPDVSPRDQRFHTLVALMLSSQTKDTVNAVAMRRLQESMPAYKEGASKGLNLENMLAVDPGLLNEMIWQVGFHNNKTKYLKAAAIILRDNFDGDVPKNVRDLTSLPGVGPKMGYLCLSAAWGITDGIGVDVHVHRITNLWDWHPKPTKNPEETRLALESWLPRDRWREINGLLVGLGQAVCLPVGRRCGQCDVGLKGLCRAADKGKINEARRTMAKAEVVEEEMMAKNGDILEIDEKLTQDVLLEAGAIKVEQTEADDETAGEGLEVTIKQEITEETILPDALPVLSPGVRRTRRAARQIP